MFQFNKKFLLPGFIMLSMMCGVSVNAQQKPSERSFSEEVLKLNKLQAERKAYAARHTPVMPVQSNPANHTAPRPGLTTPQIKPSARPIILPAKPKKQ